MNSTAHCTKNKKKKAKIAGCWLLFELQAFYIPLLFSCVVSELHLGCNKRIYRLVGEANPIHE